MSQLPIEVLCIKLALGRCESWPMGEVGRPDFTGSKGNLSFTEPTYISVRDGGIFRRFDLTSCFVYGVIQTVLPSLELANFSRLFRDLDLGAQVFGLVSEHFS